MSEVEIASAPQPGDAEPPLDWAPRFITRLRAGGGFASTAREMGLSRAEVRQRMREDHTFAELVDEAREIARDIIYERTFAAAEESVPALLQLFKTMVADSVAPSGGEPENSMKGLPPERVYAELNMEQRRHVAVCYWFSAEGIEKLGLAEKDFHAERRKRAQGEKGAMGAGRADADGAGDRSVPALG